MKTPQTNSLNFDDLILASRERSFVLHSAADAARKHAEKVGNDAHATDWFRLLLEEALKSPRDLKDLAEPGKEEGERRAVYFIADDAEGVKSFAEKKDGYLLIGRLKLTHIAAAVEAGLLREAPEVTSHAVRIWKGDEDGMFLTQLATLRVDLRTGAVHGDPKSSFIRGEQISVVS